MLGDVGECQYKKFLTLGQVCLWSYFSNVVAGVVPRDERQVGVQGGVNCGGGLPVSKVEHWWNS